MQKEKKLSIFLIESGVDMFLLKSANPDPRDDVCKNFPFGGSNVVVLIHLLCILIFDGDKNHL